MDIAVVAILLKVAHIDVLKETLRTSKYYSV